MTDPVRTEASAMKAGIGIFMFIIQKVNFEWKSAKLWTKIPRKYFVLQFSVMWLGTSAIVRPPVSSGQPAAEVIFKERYEKNRKKLTLHKTNVKNSEINIMFVFRACQTIMFLLTYCWWSSMYYICTQLYRIYNCFIVHGVKLRQLFRSEHPPLHRGYQPQDQLWPRGGDWDTHPQRQVATI